MCEQHNFYLYLKISNSIQIFFTLIAGSKNGNPPIQRNAANARERARMRVLSSAFGRLKTKLPNIPPDTKLSKLDTLRLATIYIKQLKTLVEGSTTNSENAEATIHITDIKTLNFQQCSQSMVRILNYKISFHFQLKRFTLLKNNKQY